MKKLFLGLLIFLILVFSSVNLTAQEDQPKTKYMVWEVQVTPVQHQQLLKAIQTQNAFLKEQNYPFANLIQYSNDGYLWYSVPFSNYADIDQIRATSKKLWKEHAEKSKEIQELFEGAFTAVGGLILEAQPELSIPVPESEISRTGKKFRFFEKFYIKYGKEKEFEEQIKNYVELRQRHGITDAFYTLYPDFGPNMNVVYFIDEMGTNAAEHYALNEKKWKDFGEEGKKLWEAVIPLNEKSETHIGTIDFDVSYFPPNGSINN